MDLKKLYHDVKFPGSYSGLKNFYREVKKIYPKTTLKQVKGFLKSQSLNEEDLFYANLAIVLLCGIIVFQLLELSSGIRLGV